MKNHEGYHDPTAGKAVRAWKPRRRKKRKTSLMYQIGEMPGFRALIRSAIDA